MVSVRKYWIPEKNIGLLKRPGQHHGLLVVDIVISSPVHHQKFLLVKLGCHSRYVTGLKNW